MMYSALCDEYGVHRSGFSAAFNAGMALFSMQNKLRWALGFLVNVFAEVCKYNPNLVATSSRIEDVHLFCKQAARMQGQFGTNPPETIGRAPAWENRNIMVKTGGIQALIWLAATDSTNLFPCLFPSDSVV